MATYFHWHCTWLAPWHVKFPMTPAPVREAPVRAATPPPTPAKRDDAVVDVEVVELKPRNLTTVFENM